jgi:hypothetical protein
MKAETRRFLDNYVNTNDPYVISYVDTMEKIIDHLGFGRIVHTGGGCLGIDIEIEGRYYLCANIGSEHWGVEFTEFQHCVDTDIPNEETDAIKIADKLIQTINLLEQLHKAGITILN